MRSKKHGESDSSGVHLWLVLWKAARALESHARRSIEGLGTCQSDFGVLEVLLHKGPLPVNAAGAKVLLTSGSITTAIDRLERRGLVERRGDANDRRARIVHLTDHGRSVIGKLFADHERSMESAVAALSLRERSTLVELLRKLGRSAEELLKERRKEVAESSARRKKN
jgi:MarR family 2-MHQ and catechol resistance regulon transcriptional repressor